MEGSSPEAPPPPRERRATETRLLVATLDEPARGRGEQIPSFRRQCQPRCRTTTLDSGMPSASRTRRRASPSGRNRRVAAQTTAPARSPAPRAAASRASASVTATNLSTPRPATPNFAGPAAFGQMALVDRLLELRPVVPDHRPAPGRHDAPEGRRCRECTMPQSVSATALVGLGARARSVRGEVRGRKCTVEPPTRSRSHHSAPRTSSGNPYADGARPCPQLGVEELELPDERAPCTGPRSRRRGGRERARSRLELLDRREQRGVQDAPRAWARVRPTGRAELHQRRGSPSSAWIAVSIARGSSGGTARPDPMRWISAAAWPLPA